MMVHHWHVEDSLTTQRSGAYRRWTGANSAVGRMTVVMARKGWMAQRHSEDATHDLIITLQRPDHDGAATLGLLRCGELGCVDAAPARAYQD